MSPRHAIIPAYLAACILLGGASAAGFLANLVLQIAALVLLVVCLLVRRSTCPSTSAQRLLALAVLLLGLFIAQLVPLPPSLWAALPGRGSVEQGFRLLGQPLPWLPLSLAPLRTIYSLMWLLPAFAVLLGVIRLGAFRPSWIAWTIIAVTVLSVGIGAMQLAGGDQSNLYFYRITNRGFAVGTFANNNHMATLLLVSIPFLAALKATAMSRKRRGAGGSSGLVVLTTTALLIVVVGLAINTSLAGLGLAVPTAPASLLLIVTRRRRLPLWAIPVLAALALGAVGAVMSAPLGNNLTGSEARQSTDSRYTSFGRTLAASKDYFPVGSGVGTFQQVYRSREDPGEVTVVFMNHAHSDLFEILLETGLPGLALLTVFLAWWARRVLAIWRTAEQDFFARAATIASGAILAHSMVDYPLRTAAVAALFAACLALMVEPRPKVKRTREDESAARHLSAD